MMVFDPAVAVWMMAAMPAFGLVCAWIARKSQGSPRQAFWQRLFYGALVAVGLVCMFGTVLGPGWWLSSGATLPVMVLTATCDVGSARRASAMPGT